MKEDKATEKAKESWSGHSFVPSEIEYTANYSVPKPTPDTSQGSERDTSEPDAGSGKARE